MLKKKIQKFICLTLVRLFKNILTCVHKAKKTNKKNNKLFKNNEIKLNINLHVFRRKKENIIKEDNWDIFEAQAGEVSL